MYQILRTQGLHPCKTLWNVWEDILSKHHQANIPWIECIFFIPIKLNVADTLKDQMRRLLLSCQ